MPPGMVLSAVTLNSFEPYFSLPTSDELHEAGAGVVGLVADDAIELGGVRDDLVDRQHRVRRRQDQVLDAHRRPAWRCTISTASVGDPLGVLEHLARLRRLPSRRSSARR